MFDTRLSLVLQLFYLLCLGHSIVSLSLNDNSVRELKVQPFGLWRLCGMHLNSSHSSFRSFDPLND